MQAERSLPKALTGQNVDDLEAADVPRALAVVDQEIEDALGPGLPPLGDWLPTRVDYCESVQLGNEMLVLRTLDRLAGIELPWKGLPVRGDARSVSWAKGSIRPKFYSKYLETKGDPRALGVLRNEFGVFRAQSFRDVLGAVAGEPIDARLAARAAAAGPALKLVDVLVPEVRDYVRGRYADRFGGGLMSEKELGDVELIRELVRFFGGRRGAALLGYCMVAAAFGATTRKEMLGVGALSVATRYRVLADIRRFHDHLRAKGYLAGGAPETEAEEDAALDALIGRLGSAAQRAA